MMRLVSILKKLLIPFELIGNDYFEPPLGQLKCNTERNLVFFMVRQYAKAINRNISLLVVATPTDVVENKIVTGNFAIDHSVFIEDLKVLRNGIRY